jgi:TIR domain
MSRHPYYILNDITTHAKRLLGNESLLVEPTPPGHEYPIFQPICRIEEGMASAAYWFNRFYEEYKKRVAEFTQPPFPLRIRREIDEIREIIEERIRRWGWEYVLPQEGIDRIAERLKAHTIARYVPFLDAALSWRSGKNLASHRGADDFADEAERLHVEPTMTPEEGERVIWDRHREWYMSPALADAWPVISIQEHQRLAKSVDGIGAYLAQVPFPESNMQHEKNSEEARKVGKAADANGDDEKDDRTDMTETASARSAGGQYDPSRSFPSMLLPSPKGEPPSFGIGGIFISYSWTDSAFVEKLYERLTKEGITVWLDRHEMVAGAMQKQVHGAIQSNDIVVIVISEASIQSDWVENELEMARKKEKAEDRDVLCPISLDDSWKSKMEQEEPNRALWLTLKQKNILDFSKWKTKAFEPVYQKLVRGLKTYYQPASQSSSADRAVKTDGEAPTGLAIPPLIEVWKFLEPTPRLKSIAEIHSGIEWQNSVAEGDRRSDTLRTGYQKGYWSAEEAELLAYQPPRSVYLNIEKEKLRRGINYAWSDKKVFVNAIRLSRKGWRYVAFIDYEGLYGTHHFLGVWPKVPDTTIEYIAAILNNPLAVAYVASHATGMRNNKNILDQIPVPQNNEEEQEAVTMLVRKYLTKLAEPNGPTLFGPGKAPDTLLEIDAIILKGYGLPEVLQLKVLSYLRHETRPVQFSFNINGLESLLAERAPARIQEPVKTWKSYNDRRAVLIDKELTEGLSPDERRQLKELQDAADSYLDRFEPLPLEDLSWLEDRVRQLKREAQQRGQ